MADVYTKTGDKGQTSLYSGERVDKDCLRVEAYGSIDELDAVLGVARHACQHGRVADTIYKIQKDLWLLMADVATLGGSPKITDEYVEELEHLIDDFDAQLEPLSQFLVPGVNEADAHLGVARTVARRCERAVWRLSRTEEVHGSTVRYLNRLSDLCFILGRVESEVHSM